MKNSDIDWKVGKRVRDNEKNAHETWRERIPNCFQLDCSEGGTKILFLGVAGGGSNFKSAMAGTQQRNGLA